MATIGKKYYFKFWPEEQLNKEKEIEKKDKKDKKTKKVKPFQSFDSYAGRN